MAPNRDEDYRLKSNSGSSNRIRQLSIVERLYIEEHSTAQNYTNSLELAEKMRIPLSLLVIHRATFLGKKTFASLDQDYATIKKFIQDANTLYHQSKKEIQKIQENIKQIQGLEYTTSCPFCKQLRLIVEKYQSRVIRITSGDLYHSKTFCDQMLAMRDEVQKMCTELCEIWTLLGVEI